MADLLVRNAALLATCDADGREIPGGWVAVTDGLVSGVGASDGCGGATGCAVVDLVSGVGTAAQPAVPRSAASVAIATGRNLMPAPCRRRGR